MTAAPEPKDKLDATPAALGVVNGPEGVFLDWTAVDWRQVEQDVRRLRQRIFTASRAGDLAKVRSLQKLMLRSRANTLLSVRRVTERNTGRETAGIDGEVALSAEARMQLAIRVQRTKLSDARPVKRVYIPKRGTQKQRPLGIPVILDRVHQARVANALGSPRARTRGASGCSTPTWQRRSTASITTTCWPCSARSPPGE